MIEKVILLVCLIVSTAVILQMGSTNRRLQASIVKFVNTDAELKQADADLKKYADGLQNSCRKLQVEDAELQKQTARLMATCR